MFISCRHLLHTEVENPPSHRFQLFCCARLVAIHDVSVDDVFNFVKDEVTSLRRYIGGGNCENLAFFFETYMVLV